MPIFSFFHTFCCLLLQPTILHLHPSKKVDRNWCDQNSEYSALHHCHSKTHHKQSNARIECIATSPAPLHLSLLHANGFNPTACFLIRNFGFWYWNWKRLYWTRWKRNLSVFLINSVQFFFHQFPVFLYRNPYRIQRQTSLPTVRFRLTVDFSLTNSFDLNQNKIFIKRNKVKKK